MTFFGIFPLSLNAMWSILSILRSFMPFGNWCFYDVFGVFPVVSQCDVVNFVYFGGHFGGHLCHLCHLEIGVFHAKFHGALRLPQYISR